MKRDHQVTGNIGLYWTCYQLSQLGWNAMPTARNARGVDVEKTRCGPPCFGVTWRTSPAGLGITRERIVAVTLP